MKRVLILSDLHAGHRAGLTPPGWWYNRESQDYRRDWRRQQVACWEWYQANTRALKHVDCIIVNGDSLDGTGHRKGGVEQITTDRMEQVAMAAQCIRLACRKGTKVIITRGTPYHTGDAEDFEDILGGEVSAEKVGNHEWVEVDGVTFDCKHKVGSSTVPHGRHTALARERLWNVLWSERDESPRGDVVVRSHVHYHNFCGGSDWLALTTPALQALGSDYGSRQCSGVVDYGFVVFDIDKGKYQWRANCVRLREMQPRKVVI